jgi:mono/diheme cytochrome c family protein
MAEAKSSRAPRLRSGQAPLGIRCLLLGVALCSCATPSSDSETKASAPPPPPVTYDLGAPIDSAKLAKIDIDIDPTGAHLPPGSGTPAAGLVVYVKNCAVCHGAKGEGIAPAPMLIGRDPREGFPFGRDPKLVRTVGNYWPYATTVYDYVHRAMPLKTPGSLTPDEVYAVVAWLLSENEIIPKDAVMNAKTLPAVKMPAFGHFVVDDRQGKVVR